MTHTHMLPSACFMIQNRKLCLWDLLGRRALELEALAVVVVVVTTNMLIFAKNSLTHSLNHIYFI